VLDLTDDRDQSPDVPADDEAALKSMLEENHIDINALDEDGDTALICAARSGDLAGAKVAIRLGADVNMRSQDDDPTTPLLTAIANEQPEIALLLLDHGADPNAADTSVGETPLMRASALGDPALVESLLAKGASVTARDDLNRTALHAACDKGKGEAVALLIAQGADLDAQDDLGEAPLGRAIGHGVDIVRQLLDAGADVEGGRRLSPLMQAVKLQDKETIRLLMERGANLDTRTSGGWTALTMALDGGNKEISDLLMQCEVERRLKAKDAERAAEEQRVEKIALDQAVEKGMPLQRPVTVSHPLRIQRPKP
jgi:ankyrin repeat protein